MGFGNPSAKTGVSVSPMAMPMGTLLSLSFNLRPILAVADGVRDGRMTAMAVSPATRQLCDAMFPDDEAASVLALLDLYTGAECERVHQAVIRLSGGRLGRLRIWLDEAKRNPETVLWFGESPSDVSQDTHTFGVEFINGFLDRHLDTPAEPTGE
ncbi:hypothetical protein AB0G51_01280 [Streptomyces asoensis]|uniref:hypothetical protein n=1 Tax=Streptomyces asoensis TaxID=249586 RepID=UPI00341031DF